MRKEDVIQPHGFFAPSIIERLHETILGKGEPNRTIETPVYDFNERAA